MGRGGDEEEAGACGLGFEEGGGKGGVFSGVAGAVFGKDVGVGDAGTGEEVADGGCVGRFGAGEGGASAGEEDIFDFPGVVELDGVDEAIGVAVEVDAVWEFFDDPAEAAEDDAGIVSAFQGADEDGAGFPGAGGEIDGEGVGEEDGHGYACREEPDPRFAVAADEADDEEGDGPVEGLDEEEEDFGEDEEHGSGGTHEGKWYLRISQHSFFHFGNK